MTSFARPSRLPFWLGAVGVVVATALLLVLRSTGAGALTSLTPSTATTATTGTATTAGTAATTPSATSTASAGAAGSSPSASAAPASPYRVVGLGDSVPAGSACGCTSYVALVGQHEAALKGTTAAVTNLAEGGLTTSGLLTQLQEPAVRKAVAAADLIIVTIGANDFDVDDVSATSCSAPALTCDQPVLKQQASELATVLREIGALQGEHQGSVLVTGYWNVFLDGQVAGALGSTYVKNSTALTLAENAEIASIARAHGDTYVDIYAPFKGDGDRDDTALLAADGNHPDAAGHRAIAAALEAAL